MFEPNDIPLNKPPAVLAEANSPPPKRPEPAEVLEELNKDPLLAAVAENNPLLEATEPVEERELNRPPEVAPPVKAVPDDCNGLAANRETPANGLPLSPASD